MKPIMTIYLTIAESLGTDNEFTSEVYTFNTQGDACETATSLIADMIETMDLDRSINPAYVWELEGDGWFYRVRVEPREIYV